MTQFTKIVLFISILTVCSVWMVTWSSPSKHLTIVFCDVKQGDAILISYLKTQILVDGGPGKEVLGCLDENLPLGDKTIELGIITHPDQDHLGGIIEAMQYYQFKQLATTPVGKQTQVYQRLLDHVRKHIESSDTSLIVNNLYSGDIISLGEIKTTVIWPGRQWVEKKLSSPGLRIDSGSQYSAILGASTNHSDVNDFSLVLHLQFGHFDLLLNGDAESSVQDDQLTTGLVPQSVEVMTQPHHGSKNGLLDDWFQVVKPDTVVISVGSLNRYGHPAPQILSKLEGGGVKVLRTDHLGDIVIQTDGDSWWIKSPN